jgi:hypothetical protein
MVENGITNLPERKKTGNPKWVKGQSGNPAGRPKGIPSVAGDVKESIIRIFQRVDGEARLIKIITAPTKKADEAFLSFVKNILIPILPKKTEFDVEKRVVVFDFGDGTTEQFDRNDPDNVFDVEAEDDSKVDAG